MDLKTAYETLELATDASPEEAKKRYRELTKKYHPDINKDPDAEDKFKKINEAYQCVQSGKGTDVEVPEDPFAGFRTPFSGFRNPFGNTHSGRTVNIINLYETISFKDSVLGTKRDLKYNRNIKCSECDGRGATIINNGCTQCKGTGIFTNVNGNYTMTSTCPKCHGNVKSKKCTKCTNGSVSAEVEISVSIPAGVVDGNILRLGSMGDYIGRSMLGDSYTDAHLHLTVIKDPELSIQEMDVISSININLLDALKGCEKKVSTVFGEKYIKIPAKSKHNEEIVLPSLGVNRIGNQRVKLHVEYPDDINKLIETLENN